MSKGQVQDTMWVGLQHVTSTAVMVLQKIVQRWSSFAKELNYDDNNKSENINHIAMTGH